jgi:hypothetical protein
MRRSMSYVLTLLSALLVTYSSVALSAEPIGAEVFLSSLFSRLAKTRNAILLDAASERGAAIGDVYVYASPACDILASNLAKTGKRVSLDPFDKNLGITDAQIESDREPLISGSYLISKDMAGEIGLHLRESGIGAGIDWKAFKSSLAAAQVRFRVVRRQVPFRVVESMAVGAGLTRADIPANYEGILVPFVQFHLTDFSYQEVDSKSKSQGGEAAADLLNSLLAAASASASSQALSISSSTAAIQGSTVFAFKPYVARVRHARCK